MKVLVTGAAGRIGTAFAEYARNGFDLHLTDLAPIESQYGETSRLDVTDLDACRMACKGADAVVHLAADPSPHAAFYPSVLPINIAGTYNIFHAASEVGCRRVVYASSAQATEGYPVDVQVHPDMPVRPKNLYGVSKCFGEALAAYFAYEQGLEAVAVRIGAFEYPEDHEKMNARDLSAWISPRDCCQLLVRCLEAPIDRFAIAHGVSENRFKRLDLTATCEVFRYKPQDNAFDEWDVALEE